MAEIVAEFYGGPRDGVIMSLQRYEDVVLFPYVQPISTAMEHDDEQTIHIGTVSYGLVLWDGQPVRNTSGHVRYSYLLPE